MRALYEGGGRGLPSNIAYSVLDQALRHVRDALRFDPGSEFLKDMEQSLESLRSGQPSRGPLAPRQPSADSQEITI